MLKCALNLYSKTLSVGILKKHVWHQNKNILFSSGNIIRNTSFFTKLTANDLWKSVTSVSNAGKKRGRGKGSDRKRRVHLYKDAVGERGTSNIFWPGFTGPVIDSQTLINIHKIPANTSEETPEETPQKFVQRKKIHPLLRGWSGKKIEGRELSASDPILDVSFPNFTSIIIENKLVGKMTGNLGKKRTYAVTTLVGNKEGLIGMAIGRGTTFPIAYHKGKNNAVKQLISVDLLDKHTVNHDFFCEFGSSRLFVFKKPKGYGLKCHRALAVVCKLLGITDIAVNIEGNSSNIKNIVKAFLLGLLYKQKTYQQIADETKLYLVKFTQETLNYPEVLAAPKLCPQTDEIKEKPIFEHYVMDNKIVLEKTKKILVKKKKWPTKMYNEKIQKGRIDILAEYGKFKSFLADRYPECEITNIRRPKIEESQ